MLSTLVAELNGQIKQATETNFSLYNPLWHTNSITDQNVNKTQFFHMFNINYGMFRYSRPSADILVLQIIKQFEEG